MRQVATEFDRLSTRELDVLREIAAGQGPTAIARGLNVSVKTIETYRHRIKEKLHLTTSEQLEHAAQACWAFTTASAALNSIVG